MGSEQNRFPQQERERERERKRWGGCWGGLSCFGTQKGGKRIVPASRIPEGNASATQPNGPQAVGLTNQTTALAPSLLAPPSSPASFTNSALPSTAQSPSCFLSMSANSPEGPSSTMFATGPYAHETQLVSPPVFSTFTTEPSTAPLTPPPELAHLTTPSSPDVPFAQFLSSSMDLKSAGKTNYIAANDLQATYSLYPGSPASSLISPISRTSGDCLSSSFPEREFPPRWDPSISPQNAKYPRNGSGRLFGLDTASSSISQDSNFFCPATFAQFYLDHTQQSYPPFPSGGRLSLSRESDVYSSGGNGHQNRHNKNCKQDVEEIEAYRASFGFSADEIITTTQYVEISDVLEDSFTMTPFTSNKPDMEENVVPAVVHEGPKDQTNLLNEESLKSESGLVDEGGCCEGLPSCKTFEDHKSERQSGNESGSSTPGKHILTDEEEIFPKGASKIGRKYHLGLSSSDAEIDYRRGRSLREGKGDFAWHD
ncbi:hypothetical protein VitviT2T_026839 [Vitis vinifera]|uniref:Hydroxyproline-rich glycoprotein family protein n=1 Tax=Vitis vinifera TaxID=29760 RepID=A0ABY9DRB6_VITVI|nr:uncharacterized protein At1g76660 isoform X2 [Vitis vinifera]WKA09165.1 hypothetical protein VitviT2T_026839 [Vitis vinifera]|eukprot:XP_010664049.1 PREDICTED: uncharacterized protein At1g76660 isoform X2 [Vitis vinifera]